MEHGSIDVSKMVVVEVQAPQCFLESENENESWKSDE